MLFCFVLNVHSLINLLHKSWYHFSNLTINGIVSHAPPNTPMAALTRVFLSGWRILKTSNVLLLPPGWPPPGHPLDLAARVSSYSMLPASDTRSKPRALVLRPPPWPVYESGVGLPPCVFRTSHGNPQPVSNGGLLGPTPAKLLPCMQISIGFQNSLECLFTNT